MPHMPAYSRLSNKSDVTAEAPDASRIALLGYTS